MPNDTATAACLSENVVLAFINGQASAQTRKDVEKHLSGCPSCVVLVALAARGGQTGATTMSEGPPTPRPTRPRGSSIGRYTILDLVGQGGMGEVYAAYDPELDRRVAVKLLHEEGGTPAGKQPHEEARARLLREAKAIARLSHPNVIVVHDAGTVDGRVFIAMEFVRGMTLAEWLLQRPRTWPEIRDAFLAAGRGLAAAHAAGLIHRDVKPQNIMIGNDGSIRVTDFGLASDALDVPDESTTRADSLVMGMRPLETSLTRTGAWLGTPLYMAPEQFRAQQADARTDQFAFCVSLYEAVYGERPFAAASLRQLRDAVVAGEVRPPPAKSRVPAWLRKLILRGLSGRPTDRFPSMEALLTALQRDPARRRRRVVAGAMVVASLLTVGAVVQRSVGPSTTVVCSGGMEKLMPIWELPDVPGPHPRRLASQKAFLATGDTLASTSWEKAARALDDYARRWSAMFRESCEATHVTGEQSPQVLDLRTDCLHSSLDGLRAITDLFIDADREIVTSAAMVTTGLSDLMRCADTRLLRAIVKPPDDPTQRARADELRRRIAAVQALTNAGKPSQALTGAPGLIKDAVALGYQPTIAEALSAIGLAHYWVGDELAAKRYLQQALPAAVSAHDDPKAAEIVALIAGIPVLSYGEEGGDWAHLGDAFLSRAGASGDRARGWLAQTRGVVLTRAEQFSEAVVWLRRAIEFKQKVVGVMGVDVAISQDALAVALLGMGDLAAALETSEQACEVYRRASGPQGSFLALALSNRGEILSKAGRLDEALEAFEGSINMFAKSLSPDTPVLSYPLTGRGRAYLSLGKPQEAVVPLERALALREKGDRQPQNLAETRFALAQALWDSGGDRGRAIALAQQARDGYDRLSLPSAKAMVLEISPWLQNHRSARRVATRP